MIGLLVDIAYPTFCPVNKQALIENIGGKITTKFAMIYLPKVSGSQTMRDDPYIPTYAYPDAAAELG